MFGFDFVQLFDAGVNHIDARDENILLGGDTWAIIDWQYANFWQPRAPMLLEHLATYFIRNAPADAHGALLEDWLSELEQAACATQPLRASVDRLLAHKQNTKARLALRPPQ